jgi:hypothetical protein
MKITYIAEVDATVANIDDMKGVKFTKRLESESPAKLLEALGFTNGTGNGVPTLEQLLVHLYEKKAAYAGRNYIIFIKQEA